VEDQALRIQLIMAGLGFAGPANPTMHNGMFAMTSSDKYNAFRRACKEAMRKKTKPNLEEQAEDAFKDDPRAAEEVEYGKVTNKYTHVETKSILDEF
tara:strand:+ start:215 stop:505 length:291 start_codon:yes stop_codon:yes gene_type:complete